MNTDLGGVAGAGGTAKLGGFAGAGGTAKLGGVADGGGPGGFGAALASGLSAAPGSGPGSGIGVNGGFSAVFERAGGYAEQGETVASGASKGEDKTCLNTTTESKAPVAGKENFKGSWQPMLRGWGMSARATDNAAEDNVGESGEGNTANESSRRPSAGSTRAALISPGADATRSTPVAGGRNGSTSSAAIPAKGAARAKQLPATTDGPTVMASAQNARAWSATKPAASVTSSPAGLKLEKQKGHAQSEGAQGQASQGANATAGSQADGYSAQRAALVQANIPAVNLTSPAAPGDSERLDDRVGASPATAEQPTPRLVFALSGMKGAASAAPGTAATNSNVSAPTAGQIPIHAAQSSASNRAIHAGSTSGIERQVREPDGENGEIATPEHLSLKSAAIAPDSSLNPKGASRAGDQLRRRREQVSGQGFRRASRGWHGQRGYIRAVSIAERSGQARRGRGSRKPADANAASCASGCRRRCERSNLATKWVARHPGAKLRDGNVGHGARSGKRSWNREHSSNDRQLDRGTSTSAARNVCRARCGNHRWRAELGSCRRTPG